MIKRDECRDPRGPPPRVDRGFMKRFLLGNSTGSSVVLGRNLQVWRVFLLKNLSRVCDNALAQVSGVNSK